MKSISTFLSALCAVSIAAGLNVTSAIAAEAEWKTALAQMPLKTTQHELTWSNLVSVTLNSFQSNSAVKALIFMPGAQDEFYFHRKVNVPVSSGSTLADALVALTNRNPVQLSTRGAYLLVHAKNDSLEARGTAGDPATAEKLKQQTAAVPHILFNDASWDRVVDELGRQIKLGILPRRGSPDSWHFYRHAFAGWNLSGWEALEVSALANKTVFTVERKRVVFRLQAAGH